MALDKKRLKRDIERERKRAVKARIAELRERIGSARAARKSELALIREQCKRERQALTITCSTRREEARAVARAAIDEERKARKAIDRQEDTYREVDGRNRKKAPRKAERREESDTEVRNNLPADFVPVFEKRARFVKGTVRKTRTEAFLEWAEENPGEVWAIRSSDADREVEQMIAEHAKLLRSEQRRRRASNLDEIPF